MTDELCVDGDLDLRRARWVHDLGPQRGALARGPRRETEERGGERERKEGQAGHDCEEAEDHGSGDERARATELGEQGAADGRVFAFVGGAGTCDDQAGGGGDDQGRHLGDQAVPDCEQRVEARRVGRGKAASKNADRKAAHE